MDDVLLRRATLEDGPELVRVWRSAVEATHDFLAAADLAEIEAHLVPDYFPHVTLTVAEAGGRPVGFAGTAERKLEMLFVHDDFRGMGIGSRLMARVVRDDDVAFVDVNEANPQAVGFYLAKGFEVFERTEVDDQGKPYPLLRMRLSGSR